VWCWGAVIQWVQCRVQWDGGFSGFSAPWTDIPALLYTVIGATLTLTLTLKLALQIYSNTAFTDSY